MPQSNQAKRNRIQWLLTAVFVILLFLALLLCLRGCTPQSIFEGKIQSPLSEVRPLSPVCIQELLGLDANEDGIPDYQQIGGFEPRTEYDRQVLAALQWLSDHINSLDGEEYDPSPKPSKEGYPTLPPPPYLEHEGLYQEHTPSEPPVEIDSSDASNFSTSSLAADNSSSTESIPESSSGPDVGTRPASPSTRPSVPQITGIEIQTPPNKTDYIEGERFDPTGMAVVMKLSDLTRASVTAFQYPTVPLVLGTAVVPVSMPTGSKTFTTNAAVTVRAKKLVELQVEVQKEFIEGQIPAPEDFRVTGSYDNGETAWIPDAKIEISNDPLALGQTEIVLTVTADERTDSTAVSVIVKPKSPVELILTHGPDKTDYIAGQSFVRTGMAVVIRYDNGEEQAVDDYTVSSQTLIESQTVVKISYTENGVTVGAAVPVTVRPETLIGLELLKPPIKTDYPEGVPFDADGIVLCRRFDNGLSDTVETCDHDNTIFQMGDTSKTVSVTYRDVTLSVDVPVTVRQTLPVTVTVCSYPDDMSQNAGARLDLAGMELEICYDNGTTVIVPASDPRVSLSGGMQNYDRIPPVTLLTDYPLADCMFTDKDTTVAGLDFPGSPKLRITPYLSRPTLLLSDNVPYYKVGHPIGPTGLMVRFDYLGGDSVQTAPCDPENADDEVTRLLADGLIALQYEETVATNEGAVDKPVKITLAPSRKFVDTRGSSVQVQVAPLLPDRIQVAAMPEKTRYVNDSSFDPKGMALKAVMNNGEVRELGPNSPGVDFGYDAGAGFEQMSSGSAILKNQNETSLARYTYNGKTVSVPFRLNIEDEVPISLKRHGDVSALAFTENTAFLPGDISYTILLSNGKTLTVPYYNRTVPDLTPGEPTPSGKQGYVTAASPAPNDKLVAGENAEYGGNIARFAFTMNGAVAEDEFSYELEHRHVELIEAEATKQYDHGESILPADFRVTLHWNNGESSMADPANITVSRGTASNTELGSSSNTVTIGVQDLLVIGNPTYTLEVTVKAPIPVRLSITNPPIQTQYINGTKFNPSGLKLLASYSNGAAAELLPGSIGVSVDTASEILFGTTEMSIHYSYNGKTVSVSVPITVIHETPTVVQVVSPPAKTTYVVGNALNLAGLSIQVTLSNGKTATLPYNAAGVACTPAHGAVLKATDSPITIRYTLWGVTKQTSQPLSILQYVTCSSCNGTGSRTCGSCGGSGDRTVTCSSCGGSGNGAQIWVCGKCGETTTGSRPGSVHSPCAPEGGWYSGGYENCSSCRGTGSKTSSCSSCGGSGSRTCSICGGSGTVLASRNISFLLALPKPFTSTEPAAEEETPVQFGCGEGFCTTPGSVHITTSDSAVIPVDVYYAMPDGETNLENALFFVAYSDGSRERIPFGSVEITYPDERLRLLYRARGRWVWRTYPRGNRLRADS